MTLELCLCSRVWWAHHIYRLHETLPQLSVSAVYVARLSRRTSELVTCMQLPTGIIEETIVGPKDIGFDNLFPEPDPHMNSRLKLRLDEGTMIIEGNMATLVAWHACGSSIVY